MEILVNELSLTGQFSTTDEFTLTLKEVIKILKGFSKRNFSLLKKYDFYSSKVTPSETFHAVLTGKASRKNDLIRRYKSQLCSFLDSPYWEDDQKHSAGQRYSFMERDVNGSSLAEACERDKVVLSFPHADFKQKLISVFKNSQPVTLCNLIHLGDFYEFLSEKKLLSVEEEFVIRFPQARLDFSKLSKEFGFGLLIENDVKDAFFSSFEKFVKLEWSNIPKDDGLRYKPYK